MRAWVTAVILSLQATLSLADDNPKAVTRADTLPHQTDPQQADPNQAAPQQNEPGANRIERGNSLAVMSGHADPDIRSVLLGRDLFYDPILSGNRNIACATCHHPRLGSSDGMSLSLGEGGIGLGPDRVVLRGQAPRARIPRNAPALWNLGQAEFTVMFHDGRVQIDENAPHGIKMPEGRTLERPLPSALAAQVILPVLSPEEMAGAPGENDVADAVAREHIRGRGGAWDILARRVQAIPGYRSRFQDLQDQPRPLHITDIGKALADFIAVEFQADASPYDAFLKGNATALPPAARRGLTLFEGKAGCAGCHAGRFQTDHGFHAIGMPQLGPGKEETGLPADLGRHYVTGDPEDRYRFRTPSLRNVAQTAPYGHSGAFASLEAMLRHHLDPVAGLMGYDRAQALLHKADLPADWQVLDDQDELIEIAAAIELAPLELSDAEIADLLAFLAALTDEAALKGRLGVPQTVPSGLPVEN